MKPEEKVKKMVDLILDYEQKEADMAKTRSAVFLPPDVKAKLLDLQLTLLYDMKNILLS